MNGLIVASLKKYDVKLTQGRTFKVKKISIEIIEQF